MRNNTETSKNTVCLFLTKLNICSPYALKFIPTTLPKEMKIYISQKPVYKCRKNIQKSVYKNQN